MKSFLLFVSFFAISLAENIDCPNGSEQLSCDPSQCQLPDCACAGTEPDLDVSQRPQIVYLSFDDAMTVQFDENYYAELFLPDANGNYKYVNPNGSPIRATFFVTAKSNDYQVSNKYWRHHHEIASHSIT